MAGEEPTFVAGPRLLEEFEADIADLGDLTEHQREHCYKAWLHWNAAKAAVRIAQGVF